MHRVATLLLSKPLSARISARFSRRAFNATICRRLSIADWQYLFLTVAAAAAAATATVWRASENGRHMSSRRRWRTSLPEADASPTPAGVGILPGNVSEFLPTAELQSLHCRYISCHSELSNFLLSYVLLIFSSRTIHSVRGNEYKLILMKDWQICWLPLQLMLLFT